MSGIWITDETPARVLFVKGRSGIDPDCLVAYGENGEGPLWIVDGIGREVGAFVCGLGDKPIHARLIKPASLPTSKGVEP